MRFSIVLLLYDPADRFAVTEEALPFSFSRLRTLKGTFELVVVNNSTPGESPRLCDYLANNLRLFPEATLVQEAGNLGISAGFNDGFRHLRGDSDVVVFMSGDACIVDSSILNKIEHVFSLSRKIGCVHPVSVFEDGPRVCNLCPEYDMGAFQEHLRLGIDHCRRIEAEFEEQLDLVVAKLASRAAPLRGPLPVSPLTFFCVRNDVFRLLNGFDESFVGGYENIDFVFRAMSRRYYTVLANRAFVYHRRLLFRTLGQTGPDGEIYRRQAERSAFVWRMKYGDEEAFSLFCKIWLGSGMVGRLATGALKSYLRAKRSLRSRHRSMDRKV